MLTPMLFGLAQSRSFCQHCCCKWYAF